MRSSTESEEYNDLYTDILTTEELPEWETIRPTQNPTGLSWKFVMLHKTDSNGHDKIWQIGYDSDERELVIFQGYATSPSETDRILIIPKASRTIQEQALLEARSRFRNISFNGFGLPGSTNNTRYARIKGNPYNIRMKIKFPVIVTPKYDGNGCSIRMTSNGMSIDSCTGKTNYNHLIQLYSEMESLYQILDPSTVIDGELYIHGESHQNIRSIVSRVKTPHPDQDSMMLYIYDMHTNLNMPYEYRMLNMIEILEFQNVSLPHVILTDSYVCYNIERVLELRDMYYNLDYEGVILKYTSISSMCGNEMTEDIITFMRSIDQYDKYEESIIDRKGNIKFNVNYLKSLYPKSGSTRIRMIKFKKWLDTEGIVVSVRVETRGREKGLGTLIVQDPMYEEYTYSIRGCKGEDRLTWAQDPSIVIDRWFKFKYHGRSNDGACIQPTKIGFRDFD